MHPWKTRTKNLLNRLHPPFRGQSFIELALILPVVLLMLLGLVEVVFFIARYLDALDLTREAARFASVRDPIAAVANDQDCNTVNYFDFNYDTACIFSPPKGSPSCSGPSDPFCNGINPYIQLDPNKDDIVISYFTVAGNTVSPTGYHFWAFSNRDASQPAKDNWKKDCQGNVVRTSPYYTVDRINSSMQSGAPPNKGFVTIEFFYCYNQVLDLPIENWIVPNPIQIHVYSIMPLPAAQPTPTPLP